MTDNFDDNLTDRTRWSPFAGAGLSVVESQGQVQITTRGNGKGYAGYVSAKHYDCTGSGAKVRLVNAGDQGLNSLEVSLAVDHRGGDRVQLIVRKGTLIVKKQLAGAQTFPMTTPYSQATMKYLQIREAGGMTYLETSPDGSVFNQVMAPFADFFPMDDVTAEVATGSYQVEASATTTAFDDFNLP